MNFMIAGRDTTACALSWTMYELCRNPAVLGKVLEEVKSVCGDERFNDEIDQDNYTYDKVADLKYTNAVAMEVLRLHPSVPVDIKFAVNDDTLPDGTFIPKGCTVIYSPYAMGRSPALWGDDCLEFKPERFMEGGEPSQYKYTTFNAGYRLCLGKGLALLEIKVALAILLQRFDFKVANDHKGTYESTLVLPMKPGLFMNITEKK
jgi:fatty acid omega-hydroxylase